MGLNSFKEYDYDLIPSEHKIIFYFYQLDCQLDLWIDKSISLDCAIKYTDEIYEIASEASQLIEDILFKRSLAQVSKIASNALSKLKISFATKKSIKCQSLKELKWSIDDEMD